MSSSISNSDHLYQLDNILKDFIKEKLEMLMKEKLNNFLQVERPDLQDSKNGYYQRSLDTRYGRVENLKVPRDRLGEFQTQFFEPYQRRDGWLEEAIIKMYQSGMSTCEIGSFVEIILGSAYSATTISNITDVALEDIQKWHQRPLNKRYSVLYLDGMYIKLRRDVRSFTLLLVSLKMDIVRSSGSM
jgi:putative transposase